MSEGRLQPHAGDDSFRLLLETIDDCAICLLDPEGRVAWWNRGSTIEGFSESEIVGKHFSLFYPDEDVQAGRPDLALRMAAAEGRFEDEVFHVRKDGSFFLARVVLTALRDGAGNLIGFAKLTRDVANERGHLEPNASVARALEEAQPVNPIGSWTWDVAANRVTWSDEVYRIYGLARVEFAATFAAYLSLVHPDDRDDVRKRIEISYATREPFESEQRIIRSDGAIRLLQCRGRVITDASGAVLRMVGTCADITEQKQREERARRSLREQAAVAEARAAVQRFEFLARASDILDSSLDYELTLHNVAQMAVPAMADWCTVDLLADDGSLRRLVMVHTDPQRVRRAELIRDRYPGADEDTDPVRKAVKTLQPELISVAADDTDDSGLTEPFHLKLFRRFGLRSVIICPLASEGRALGAISFASAESGRRYEAIDLAHAQELARRAATAIERARLIDSVARANARLVQQAAELEAQSEVLHQAVEEYEVANKALLRANEALAQKTEEAERARKAAELASHARSDFLSHVSHELRTPLNAMAGYTQLIELGVHGPITPQQTEAIRRIQKNQRYLLGLINDILNFVKLEGGQVRLDLEALRLADVLVDLELLVEPQARVRGVEFMLETPDRELMARADREKLDQVLLNLLSNAIKFTPPGGQIIVRCDADPGQVRLHVKDTGVGIPTEKLEGIFEPFVQLGAPARPLDSEGLGLGLAISRDLMTNMGGRLTVWSELGLGSTFTLVLPRAYAQHEDAAILSVGMAPA